MVGSLNGRASTSLHDQPPLSPSSPSPFAASSSSAISASASASFSASPSVPVLPPRSPVPPLRVDTTGTHSQPPVSADSQLSPSPSPLTPGLASDISTPVHPVVEQLEADAAQIMADTVPMLSSQHPGADSRDSQNNQPEVKAAVPFPLDHSEEKQKVLSGLADHSERPQSEGRHLLPCLSICFFITFADIDSSFTVFLCCCSDSGS